MPLSVSCNGLYFPSEKLDNVFTVQWSRSENETLSPSSMAVFKLKCTSPQMFHVVPRYGAFLLVDPHGVPAESMEPTSIRIGLYGHGHTSKPQTNHTNDDTSALTSHVGDRNHSYRSPSLVSGATAFSRSHKQERFVIECRLVQNQPSVYAYAAQQLPREGGRVVSTNVFKELWDMVDAKLAEVTSRAHWTTTMTTLKVYMDNVVLHPDTPSPVGDDANKVVVPPTVQLVASTLPDRFAVPLSSDRLIAATLSSSSNTARASAVPSSTTTTTTTTATRRVEPTTPVQTVTASRLSDLETSVSSHVSLASTTANGKTPSLVAMRATYRDGMGHAARLSTNAMKSLEQEIHDTRRDATPADSNGGGGVDGSRNGIRNRISNVASASSTVGGGGVMVSSTAKAGAPVIAPDLTLSKSQQEHVSNSVEYDENVIMKFPLRRCASDDRSSGLALKYVLCILVGVYCIVPILRWYVMGKFEDANEADVYL